MRVAFHFILLLFLRPFPEIPSTKLHTLFLDEQDTKLTWYIDWPDKEVLFNVDGAFIDADDSKWFSFGFSKRGELAASDLCFFVRNSVDDEKGLAIVSVCSSERFGRKGWVERNNKFSFFFDIWSNRRTRTSATMAKSTKIINRIANCYASTTNRWHSNGNLTLAIRRIFTCTKVQCIWCGHVARKSSHFPWNMKRMPRSNDTSVTRCSIAFRVPVLMMGWWWHRYCVPINWWCPNGE